jgi:hypothetical protein
LDLFGEQVIREVSLHAYRTLLRLHESDRVFEEGWRVETGVVLEHVAVIEDYREPTQVSIVFPAS